MNKPFFYLNLYQRWFMWHDGNQKLDNLEEIKETMLDGGWYRANLIPEKLTLLVFNSLEYNVQ